MGAQPPAARNQGYGAGLWLLGPAENLPAGSYAMLGNRGQYAVVVPSRNLIIVRRGFDSAGDSLDPAKFAATILAAMP